MPARFVAARERRKVVIIQAARINDPIAVITQERVKRRGQ
jgi:hypothetical protein